MLAVSAVHAAAYTTSGWPTYGATYANTRHVALNSINGSNVNRLSEVWRVHLGPHERVETTPIVSGGTMYVTTGAENSVVALDASTGRRKWRFAPQRGFMTPCCGALNRGVAVLQNRVFFATLDGQLISLDAATGKMLWHTTVGDAKRGFSETMAPLAWENRVFIGSSGGDFGIRGSLSAYAADSGKLLWRWYSVSPRWEGVYATTVNGHSLHRNAAREKAEKSHKSSAWMHGGGAIWITPALEPSTATLYLTTANPEPVFDGSTRPGDNLYTDSIVALDARRGTMRWYYQQTPHDVWEYEPSSPPVLADALSDSGKRAPAVLQAGKTRWLYIVDRSTGKLIRLSEPWTHAAEVYYPPVPPSDERQLPLRGSIGPTAYDPDRHLSLITQIERTAALSSWWESILAVDINTGHIAWKKPLGRDHDGLRGDALLGGALSTPDLVFVGEPAGMLYALSADGGGTLWQYQLGNEGPLDADAGPLKRWYHRVHDWLLPFKRAVFHQPPPGRASAGIDANPIAYETGGREFIAIAYDSQPDNASGGAAISAFSLPR